MAENADTKMRGQELAPATAPEVAHHQPDTPEQPAAKRLKVDDAADSKEVSNAGEAANGQGSRDATANGNGEKVTEPAAPRDRRAGLTPIKKE